MQGYNGAINSGFRHDARKTSISRAAIDQRAPDALDFDCLLEFEDVVLACMGRCSFGAGFARRDPALGDRIVPFAEIEHARVSCFDPPLVV
ncbi:hypothetical protein [Bradyrhizobium sp. 1]|uniref:hypothetical protein n=1 Tax=Bradyrhizobium sp. 1 TaxID=241591 RepID=UPI001FFB4D4A|nr:hypothetical protein [Bradyrhizobium sp. 1]MCK1392287.1 hypothetical protein [Bradyrhizobium sp. 1]